MISPTDTIESLENLQTEHKRLTLQAETLSLRRIVDALDASSRHVLSEAVWGDWVDRREYLTDTPGFYNLSSRISQAQDRARGRNAPFFQTETELAEIRGTARFLESLDEVSIGILESLTNYVIGTGLTYTAQPEPGGESLAPIIQQAMDEFMEANDWTGDLERELFARSRRDGEFFLALRPDCESVRARIIEPEWVTEPKDYRQVESYFGLEAYDWLFGVATCPGDSEREKAIFVQWEGQTDMGEVCCPEPCYGVNWQYVHAKLNVDRNIKRGLSDFYPAYRNLQRASKLLGNTLEGAAVQAAIAYIREHIPGVGRTGAEAMRAAEIDWTRNRTTPDGGTRTDRFKTVRPGTIADIPNGMKYHAGPLGSPQGPLYVEVLQAGLRIVGSRWCMPEYMISGDASNANYSSSLVAESPFVKASEAKQEYYIRQYSNVIWKVIGILADRGRFGGMRVRDIKRLVKLDLKAPSIAVRNRLEEAQLSQIQHHNRVLSAKTWAAQADLDYETEKQNMAEEPAPAAVPFGRDPFGQSRFNPTAAAALQGALESVRTTEEAKSLLREAYP